MYLFFLDKMIPFPDIKSYLALRLVREINFSMKLSTLFSANAMPIDNFH